MRANPHRSERVVEAGGKERIIRYPLGSMLQFELGVIDLTEQLGREELPGLAQVALLLWAGLLHESPDLLIDEIFGWEMDADKVGEICAEAWKAAGGDTGKKNAKDPTKARPKSRARSGGRSGNSKRSSGSSPAAPGS